MSHDSRSSAESLLAAALEYHRRGWSIIPTLPRAKKAATKWERYQRERANAAQLAKWFGDGAKQNIAVVFGAVSGGLLDREWDALDAYHEWADDHPELAGTLPTYQSHRGRHVLCRAAPANVEAVRAALGRPNGTGAIALGDGELRLGECYSLVPPSVHPSGTAYTWLIEPSDEIPVVDLLAAGFVPPNKLSALQSGTEWHGVAQSTPSVRREQSGTESRPPSRPSTSADSAYSVGRADENLNAKIEAAIRRTQPTRLGERRRCLFHFARHVKALPALADAPPSALRPYVRRWHELALPVVGTKPWEDTWFDFTKALADVKYPAGTEPIAILLAHADGAEPPDVALEYDHPALRRLVALCRELQRAAGDAPFYLSARTGERLLSIHYTSVSAWLRGLCRDGVLRLVERGSQAGHRASRYRYLGRL